MDSESRSCAGCVWRQWIRAAGMGRSTSASGWGCALTGGHAVIRCEEYEEEGTQEE
jgi:hypothetical protein